MDEDRVIGYDEARRIIDSFIDERMFLTRAEWREIDNLRKLANEDVADALLLQAAWWQLREQTVGRRINKV